MYKKDVNLLLALSTVYSRIGVRYHRVAATSDSLEAFEKSTSTTETALSLIETVGSLHPGAGDSSGIIQNLATMYCDVARYLGKRERWTDAIPYLKRAVEVNPQDDVAWLLLGYAYFPKVQESIVYWRQAAELGNTEAINNLRQWSR